MRKEALKYLVCCQCNSKFKTENTRKYRGDIRSGTLKCSECNLEFPIILGRPVLMTSGSINHWKSPIDEALGIDEPTIPPLSIPRLVSLEIDSAISILRARMNQKKNQDSCEDRSTIEISESIYGNMRYRASGEWFQHAGRKERLLTFPYRSKGDQSSFIEFMKAIENTKPESLLDLASGGGYGVSHQVFRNRRIRQTIAIERDLKCLTNIQYRFKFVGGDRTSEAVGGNVRKLPVQSGSIDTAMMLQALPEICGISILLKEVHRTLKNGGYFIALYSEVPPVWNLMPVSDFCRFAVEADLYAGYEKFVSDAEDCGFEIMESRHLEEKTRPLRLTVFRK